MPRIKHLELRTQKPKACGFGFGFDGNSGSHFPLRGLSDLEGLAGFGGELSQCATSHSWAYVGFHGILNLGSHNWGSHIAALHAAVTGSVQ